MDNTLIEKLILFDRTPGLIKAVLETEVSNDPYSEFLWTIAEMMDVYCLRWNKSKEVVLVEFKRYYDGEKGWITVELKNTWEATHDNIERASQEFYRYMRSKDEDVHCTEIPDGFLCLDNETESFHWKEIEL